MAVSLTLILTTTGLAYYLMQPPRVFPDPWEKRNYVPGIPHATIAIDGDANFSDTAFLEGWPGNGTPEYPYIIDGLNISMRSHRHCIAINNTQVSFIISNCSFHGVVAGMAWEAGIYLENVTNGEIVHNTFSSNDCGIYLNDSHNNTMANNTCNSNGINALYWASGICLENSDSNTVVTNICYDNEQGIILYYSHRNIVSDNICNNNWNGISLEDSNSNTVTNNTCYSDDDHGISLHESDSNTVANNTCSGNEFSGIGLEGSHSNTIANNTCNDNDIGISLEESHSTTVSDNTCNNNRIGIYIDDESDSNTLQNNTFSGTTEHDIVHESELDELAYQEYVAKQPVWFLGGFGLILVVSVNVLVRFRKMGEHSMVAPEGELS